jgi:hypothetical protein
MMRARAVCVWTPAALAQSSAWLSVIVTDCVLDGQDASTPRERELIKAMSDHEMVLQMLSNCRISSAAASKGKK